MGSRVCRFRFADTDDLIEVKWPGIELCSPGKPCWWREHEVREHRMPGSNRTAQWNAIKVTQRLASRITAARKQYLKRHQVKQSEDGPLRLLSGLEDKLATETGRC